MPTRFFLQDIKSAPWNPSRNQDKDRSILPASTSTGCNLIFTGYSSAARDAKGFPLWNFNREDFPRVVTPCVTFFMVKCLAFFKKGFLKKKKNERFSTNEWNPSMECRRINSRWSEFHGGRILFRWIWRFFFLFLLNY